MLRLRPAPPMKGVQDELGGSTGDPSGGVCCMDPKDDDSLYNMLRLHVGSVHHVGSWILAGSQ